MTELSALGAVAALNLAAAVSPGPAFVLITQTAASQKRPVALAAAAGTVLASLIWASAALLGLQLVLLRFAELYRLLQICGGVYLCLLGLSILRNASAPLAKANGSVALGIDASFRKALLLGLSNPKVIVFFGTIFTAALGPEVSPVVRWGCLLVVLVNETLWYGLLATVFGLGPVQSLYRRLKRGTERVFGGLMVLFGGRLVWNGVRPA